MATPKAERTWIMHSADAMPVHCQWLAEFIALYAHVEYLFESALSLVQPVLAS